MPHLIHLSKALMGPGALVAKADLKSAFKTLPMAVSDFPLLGFAIENDYYVNTNMPLGASASCATYEKFSTFLEWCIKHESKRDKLGHYIDDFIFWGLPDSTDCQDLLDTFGQITFAFGVPTTHENLVLPCTEIEYLGLLTDTTKQLVRVPQDKLIDIKAKINKALSHKTNKINFRGLQSLIGSLQFLCRAVALGGHSLDTYLSLQGS